MKNNTSVDQKTDTQIQVLPHFNKYKMPKLILLSGENTSPHDVLKLQVLPQWWFWDTTTSPTIPFSQTIPFNCGREKKPRNMFSEKKQTIFWSKRVWPKLIIPAMNTQTPAQQQQNSEANPSAPTSYIQEAHRQTHSRLRHWSIVWKSSFLFFPFRVKALLPPDKVCSESASRIQLQWSCKTWPVNTHFCFALKQLSQRWAGWGSELKHRLEMLSLRVTWQKELEFLGEAPCFSKLMSTQARGNRQKFSPSHLLSWPNTSQD